MKKLTILLSSILLCSCVTGADKEDRDEVKKVKADCEYYKNTPNYINWDLKAKIDKENNAYYSLDEKKPCMNSNCSIFANKKKWNFTEIELYSDNSINFPYHISQNGLYKIEKDNKLYSELKKLSEVKNLSLELLCKETDRCISCYMGNYCLVGTKIQKPVSKTKIIAKRIQKTKYSFLVNYEIKYNEDLYINYNRYIFKGNDLYSGLGFGFCENTQNSDIIMENLFKDDN